MLDEPRICPGCHEPVPGGRYCLHCGVSLEGAAPPPTAHQHRRGAGFGFGRARGSGSGKDRERPAAGGPEDARAANASFNGHPVRTASAPDAPVGAALVSLGKSNAGSNGSADSNGSAHGNPHDPASTRRATRLDRHTLALQLLAVARGDEPLEHATLPGDVASAFLRRYDARRATQEAYAGDLADWLVWLDRAETPAFAASLATIERYAREPLASGRPPAPATIARRLACLSHYYRRAAYAGLVDRNPVEAAQRPKVPERVATLGVSTDRARALIRAARAAGTRETLLVLLLLELGLRISEAIGADIEDLGEQGRHQVLALRGKGQITKATLLPLNPAVLEAIAAAIGERREGPLLVTSTGRRLTRQHAAKIIRRLGEQVGLDGLHPHELRHAFVTISLDEGQSLRDVQDAARHADPRTTRHYDRNRSRLDRHPTHRLAEVFEGAAG